MTKTLNALLLVGLLFAADAAEPIKDIPRGRTHIAILFRSGQTLNFFPDRGSILNIDTDFRYVEPQHKPKAYDYEIGNPVSQKGAFTVDLREVAAITKNTNP